MAEPLVRYRVHDAGISRSPARSFEAERVALEPALEQALRDGLITAADRRARLADLDFEYGYALLRGGDRGVARAKLLRAWVGGAPKRWRALALAGTTILPGALGARLGGPRP